VMLREVGVNVDCLPLLDVRQPGAHDISAIARSAANRCVWQRSHVPR